MNNKQEARIQLMNGQRKYGRVLGTHSNGVIRFVSFVNEQIFGIENSLNYIEEIPSEQVREIDFCLK